MDHADHVRLLRQGASAPPRQGLGSASEIDVWADLGAGEGAFTLALADLLPAGSTIHAVDKDRAALAQLERAYARFAAKRDAPRLEAHIADFTRDLALRDLDGVVMANSLHFVRDKSPVLARVRAMLKSGGRLLVVEYDTDRGNTWVPHPFSFETWRRLAPENGFEEPRLLATHPSRFLGRIYSAVALRG
jgi:ubiquinone/menaquinone biosynthesis C-methylase UbiE